MNSCIGHTSDLLLVAAPLSDDGGRGVFRLLNLFGGVGCIRSLFNSIYRNQIVMQFRAFKEFKIKANDQNNRYVVISFGILCVERARVPVDLNLFSVLYWKRLQRSIPQT